MVNAIDLHRSGRILTAIRGAPGAPRGRLRGARGAAVDPRDRCVSIGFERLWRCPRPGRRSGRLRMAPASEKLETFSRRGDPRNACAANAGHMPLKRNRFTPFGKDPSTRPGRFRGAPGVTSGRPERRRGSPRPVLFNWFSKGLALSAPGGEKVLNAERKVDNFFAPGRRPERAARNMQFPSQRVGKTGPRR